MGDYPDDYLRQLPILKYYFATFQNRVSLTKKSYSLNESSFLYFELNKKLFFI